MKNLMHSLRFLMVILFVFIWSCKPGEVGPKGETGTTGATGASGATGNAGATGAVGATGTANVIYSDWANVVFTGSGTNWTGKIIAPKITQEILDRGVVLTFFKFGGSTYSGEYQNGTAGIYCYTDLGAINLKATFSATYPWRYVIIPGGVPSGRLQSIKGMSYEEIKILYNIPD